MLIWVFHTKLLCENPTGCVFFIIISEHVSHPAKMIQLQIESNSNMIWYEIPVWNKFNEIFLEEEPPAMKSHSFFVSLFLFLNGKCKQIDMKSSKWTCWLGVQKKTCILTWRLQSDRHQVICRSSGRWRWLRRPRTELFHPCWWWHQPGARNEWLSCRWPGSLPGSGRWREGFQRWWWGEEEGDKFGSLSVWIASTWAKCWISWAVTWRLCPGQWSRPGRCRGRRWRGFSWR